MDEELGEGQWELIAPLLPKHKRRGRPRAAFFECFAPVPAGKTATKVRQPVPLPPVTPRVARPGSLGTDKAEVSRHPGLSPMYPKLL
jgi:hypothetical protein